MNNTLILLNEIIPLNEVLFVFKYGSYVYGSNDKNSDEDFIVIVKDSYMTDIEKQITIVNKDFNIYTKTRFREKLDNHDIDALECYYLFDYQHNDDRINNILLQSQLDLFNDFTINKGKLRKSISSISSNSWVKGKKKIIVEADRDIDVGIKSLYHSIRILEFGAQIAAYGTIKNYGAMNIFKKEIKFNSNLFIAKNLINFINNPNNVYDNLWEYLKHTYQTSFNTLSTAFKKIAPKELKNG